MSVLIKGVKMPKAGKRPLQIVVHPDGVVEYNSGDYGWKMTKACEVPTPHGPLIDADELKSFMYHHAFELGSADQRWDSGCWVRYRLFENAMKVAPTIIEAEEGEGHETD